MSLVLLPPNYLHALLYFVADQPTEANISLKIPLVGTDSYKRLLVWCGDMDVDITRVRLYNQCDGPFDHAFTRSTLNRAVKLGQIKVIALGQKAAAYLGNVGVDEFFVLPHPSGRNRLLNDKEFVKNKLGQCRNYIYQGVPSGEQEHEKSIEEDLRTEQELQAADGPTELE